MIKTKFNSESTIDTSFGGQNRDNIIQYQLDRETGRYLELDPSQDKVVVRLMSKDGEELSRIELPASLPDYSDVSDVYLYVDENQQLVWKKGEEVNYKSGAAIEIDSSRTINVLYDNWFTKDEDTNELGLNLNKVATKTDLTSKQDVIDVNNKVDSDFVEDAGRYNKFVTEEEKQIWNNKSVVREAQENGNILVDDHVINVYTLPSYVDAHINNTSNPHQVTKAQVGLGNADNTADLDKPISTATQAALDTKVDKVSGKELSTNDFTDALKSKLDNIEAGAQVNTVTGVKGDAEQNYRVGNINITKANLGLDNVDNTADSDKPISTATQAALDTKVDKISGKGLSANDFTDSLKSKLEGIEAGAEVNVQADWSESNTDSDSYIQNKPYIPEKVSDLTNDSEFITATDIFSSETPGTIKSSNVDGEIKANNDGTGAVNGWNSALSRISQNESDISGLDSSKQDKLGFTPENVANKVTSWSGTVSDTNYPSEKLVKDNLDTKVDKISGKGLSTEDFTTALKTKLEGIEAGAEVNIIEEVQVNGTALEVTDKSVNVTVPTKTSDITNDGDGTSIFATQSWVDENGGKIDVVKVNDVVQPVVNKTVSITTPTKVSDLSNDTGFITKDVNNLDNYTKTSDLAAVALSNSYNDLNDKPVIPIVDYPVTDVEVNGSSVVDANGVAEITIPALPTKLSELTNDTGFITKDVNNLTNYSKTSEFGAAAFSNSYSDLDNKPSIPSKTSDITNDSGFITKAVDDLTNYTKTSDLPTKTSDFTNDGDGTSEFATQSWVNTNGGKIDVIKINGVTQTVTDKTVDLPAYPTRTSLSINNVDNTADADKPISTATQNALNLKADASDLTAHINDTTNPHAVTKAQVGLGNVDNTSDLNKPISTATQSALDLKVDKVNGKGLSTEDFTSTLKTKLEGIETGAQVNTLESLSIGGTALEIDEDKNIDLPAYPTKSSLGLGNVDNTSDANKPVSTATQTALNNKVDKVTGKGLSTNDFTDTLKTKLDGIATGAQVNVLESVSINGTAVTITSKNVDLPAYPTKTSLGLDNVDNTSDADKPISTATQTALDGKVDKVNGKGLSTEDFTSALKTKLDGIETGATKTTIDDALSSSSTNPVQNKVINTALGNKVDKVNGKGLSTNDFTDAYKSQIDTNTTAISGKADISDVPTKTSDLTNDGDGTSDFATQNWVNNSSNAITSIKINGTAQTVTDKAVDLPAYPTLASLGAQAALTFDGTYNASTNKAATVSSITDRINALDVAAITGSASKTITSISESNGKISATYSDIEIAESAVTGLSTDLSSITGNISAIQGKIPSEATSSNQLADKAFVNSSISSATANFKGTFNVVDDLGLTTSATEQQIVAALATKVSSPTPNDYVFVSFPDATVATEIVKFDRYKYNGTAWAYEYTLNNSSFTANQWAAINSGITSNLVSDINSNTSARHTHSNKTVLDGISSSDVTAWNGKYALPSGGIPKTDLASAVQTSLGKADSALQSHQTITTGSTNGTISVGGTDVAVKGLGSNAYTNTAIPTKDSNLTNDRYVRFDTASQGLNDTQKANARTNIGAGTSSFSGSYNDLTNKPTIPSVSNATITIKQTGIADQTFTLNGSATTITLADTNTTYDGDRGISLVSGNFGHSNTAITAQTTQALYPIKIDAYGHITAYGTAVTSLPASDVYSWAKAANKPSYTHNEIGAGRLTIGDGANYVLYRTHESWRSGYYYHTTGTEAVVFANTNASTSWIFVNAVDPTARKDWTNLGQVPAMQIKTNSVAINKLIANGVTPSYNLDVNGTANATSYTINSKATMQYNTTDDCIDFIFN